MFPFAISEPTPAFLNPCSPSSPAADYWLFCHCSFMMDMELTLMGPSPKLVHPSDCGQGLRNYVKMLHLLMNSRLPRMWLNSKELPGLTPVVQIQDLCTSGTPTTHDEVNVQIKLGLGMSGFSLSSKEGGPWSSHSETCTSLETSALGSMPEFIQTYLPTLIFL